MFALQAVSSEDRHKSVRTEVRSPIEVTLSRIVSWFFTVIIVFLGLRFILLLLGANENTAFVNFIYQVSAVFLAPFAGVFPEQAIEGSRFDWSSLLAMLVYALISWGIIALIRAVSPREHAVTVASDVAVDRQAVVAPDPVVEREVVVAPEAVVDPDPVDTEVRVDTDYRV